MATFEEINLANRVVVYLANCQRDLRANAQSYKDEIARVPRRLTTAQLGAIVHADGAAISALMTRLTNKIQNAGLQTKLGNGLAVYGITLAQANAAKTTIAAVADAQAVADVSTDAAITAASDATLAATPAIDVID